MRQSPDPRHTTSALLLATPALLGLALFALPTAMWADEMSVAITDVVSDTLVVNSNGSRYHDVPGLANLVAESRVVVDANDLRLVVRQRLGQGVLREDEARARVLQHVADTVGRVGRV